MTQPTPEPLAGLKSEMLRYDLHLTSEEVSGVRKFFDAMKAGPYVKCVECSKWKALMRPTLPVCEECREEEEAITQAKVQAKVQANVQANVQAMTKTKTEMQAYNTATNLAECADTAARAFQNLQASVAQMEQDRRIARRHG